MPRLSAGNGVVVNERDYCDAGRNRNHPANEHPHQINIWTEFMPDVKEDARFNPVSKRHENGGSTERNPGENDQRQGNESFLHQSPDLRQLITAPEPFHPGNHYTRSEPESQE